MNLLFIFMRICYSCTSLILGLTFVLLHILTPSIMTALEKSLSSLFNQSAIGNIKSVIELYVNHFADKLVTRQEYEAPITIAEIISIWNNLTSSLHLDPSYLQSDIPDGKSTYCQHKFKSAEKTCLKLISRKSITHRFCSIHYKQNEEKDSLDIESTDILQVSGKSPLLPSIVDPVGVNPKFPPLPGKDLKNPIYTNELYLIYNRLRNNKSEVFKNLKIEDIAWIEGIFNSPDQLVENVFECQMEKITTRREEEAKILADEEKSKRAIRLAELKRQAIENGNREDSDDDSHHSENKNDSDSEQNTSDTEQNTSDTEDGSTDDSSSNNTTPNKPSDDEEPPVADGVLNINLVNNKIQKYLTTMKYSDIIDSFTDKEENIIIGEGLIYLLLPIGGIYIKIPCPYEAEITFQYVVYKILKFYESPINLHLFAYELIRDFGEKNVKNGFINIPLHICIEQIKILFNTRQVTAHHMSNPTKKMVEFKLDSIGEYKLYLEEYDPRLPMSMSCDPTDHTT